MKRKTKVEANCNYRSSHPDKITDEEKKIEAETTFKQAQEAYDTLRDEQKRRDYDLFGDGQGPRGNGSDPFDDFFRFSSAHGSPPPRRPAGGGRTQDATIDYTVTLEDLYHGKTVRISTKRNVLCSRCEGTGGRRHAKKQTCDKCKGQGYKSIMRRMGPVAFPDYVECGACQGEGQKFSPKAVCRKCKGSKIQAESKVLSFVIAPGAKDGDVFRRKGEADQHPGMETGDVVLTLHQDPHAVFLRKADDLYAEASITLVEALTGFKRALITHIDGRLVMVAHPQKNIRVLRPGHVLCIKGFGMPTKSMTLGSGYKSGRLYLKLHIEFPSDAWSIAHPDKFAKLRNLLPLSPSPSSNPDLQSSSPFVEYKVLSDATESKQSTDTNPSSCAQQ